MKILIVGGGGREHAIAQTLYKQGHTLWCAPGNGGISQIATCVPIKATDIESMVAYAVKEQFDLVVVAPDDPLAMGMVDKLNEKGIKAFGPNAAAAQIEASKAFTKELLKKYAIPTGGFSVCESVEEAYRILDTHPLPVVVKADGLALGKGVYICQTLEQAKQAVSEIMEDHVFGTAGSKVLIEEFLTGPEVSFLCFCDGKHIAPMPAAQDHKRAYDGDKGPNTGGMGAFCPTPTFTKELRQEVIDTIVLPTVRAMKKEGRSFKGVLYCGLMLTPSGPKVLEYNARFGDPETQAILPLLKSDLAEIFLATIDGTLDQLSIEWEDKAAVCIVLASGGYPKQYQSGYEIHGLAECEKTGAMVYHAGTRREEDAFLTAGGRVLGVVRTAFTLPQAIKDAYESVQEISFQDMHFRKDIGVK